MLWQDYAAMLACALTLLVVLLLLLWWLVF
jgi:hypothetical protein